MQSVSLHLQFLQLFPHPVQLRVDLVALFGVLGALVVARELVDLRGEPCDLHAPRETRVQIDGEGSSRITCEQNDSHNASTESTAGSAASSVASPAGFQSETNILDVVVCPARAGRDRRTANAHS